jgi:L,D-peptidoglycan transpeptidase YkuD (ErfK/YbiS/YcfS/YnhG family)
MNNACSRMATGKPGYWLVLMAVAILGSGCANAPVSRPALPWSNAQQVVVVITPDWNANQGALRTYERADGKWRQVGESEPVAVGRNGSAWGLGLHPGPQIDPQTHPQSGPVKREGDGRSPAGVFGIGDAFGYAQQADTALPYDAMLASHYCMDVSGSPLYNRIVDTRSVGEDAVTGSTEPMRLDLHSGGDQRYRLGFVIEHNPQAKRDAGSCIFAHLWKKPAESTAGCTAMADPTMARLLAWLRPDQHPVFVLLPTNEYAALRDAWQLPALESTP